MCCPREWGLCWGYRGKMFGCCKKNSQGVRIKVRRHPEEGSGTGVDASNQLSVKTHEPIPASPTPSSCWMGWHYKVQFTNTCG